jgi:hypothetical protein
MPTAGNRARGPPWPGVIFRNGLAENPEAWLSRNSISRNRATYTGVGAKSKPPLSDVVGDIAAPHHDLPQDPRVITERPGQEVQAPGLGLEGRDLNS